MRSKPLLAVFFVSFVGAIVGTLLVAKRAEGDTDKSRTTNLTEALALDGRRVKPMPINEAALQPEVARLKKLIAEWKKNQPGGPPASQPMSGPAPKRTFDSFTAHAGDPVHELYAGGTYLGFGTATVVGAHSATPGNNQSGTWYMMPAVAYQELKKQGYQILPLEAGVYLTFPALQGEGYVAACNVQTGAYPPKYRVLLGATDNYLVNPLAPQVSQSDTTITFSFVAAKTELTTVGIVTDSLVTIYSCTVRHLEL
jgi:hypothetical protein